MKCPNCGQHINAAAMLGAKAKGKPKAFSKAELARRRARMKAINERRRVASLA